MSVKATLRDLDSFKVAFTDYATTLLTSCRHQVALPLFVAAATPAMTVSLAGTPASAPARPGAA